jgi:hypothetical protein
VWNSVGAWVDIGVFEVSTYGQYGQRLFKLVVDFATHKYVRVVFDNQSIDASAVTYATMASVGLGLRQTVAVTSDGTNTGPVYCGGMIITDMEP